MTVDWHSALGILSSIVLLSGVAPYIMSIARGSTRPHLFSQIGWSLLSGIAAAAQLVQGAQWSVVVPIMSTVNSILILSATLYFGKRAHIHRSDIYPFLCGLLAIVVWLATSDPLLAIYISILADCLFTIPTITKIYRYPSSEALFPWMLYAVGSVLGLLSVTSLQPQNIAYPIYAVAGGTLIAILVSRQYFIRDAPRMPG